MKNIKYTFASILVLISALFSLLIYWDEITGPYRVESIVSVFSVICLAGLGLIMLKNYVWMKWVLLLILLFEFINLIEVFHYRTMFKFILSIAQCAMHVGAVILLFLIKELKHEGPTLNPIQSKS